MNRRVVGSIWPILRFFICLAGFAIFYLLFFREYIVERVYPVHDSDSAWIDAFGLFFYISVALTSLLCILWFIVSILSNPEPISIRRKWFVFFILSVVLGAGLPVLFLIFHLTASAAFNVYIFIYFFLMPVAAYQLTTITSYPEIKYSSGVWKLFGK